MFLSVVDMDACSMDVVSGTACTLCRMLDLNVGAAMLAHSIGVMMRQEELVAWRGLQDRHLSPAGDFQWRREELETSWLIAIPWHVSRQPHRESLAENRPRPCK
jgi:hypothetical protein